MGYSIRLESKRSSATRLLFCTTGVLLRRLHADGGLKGVSHVIVDEVHERSLDGDFLLIVLRDLLVMRPSWLVLMSATLNADLFASYWALAARAAPRALRRLASSDAPPPEAEPLPAAGAPEVADAAEGATALGPLAAALAAAELEDSDGDDDGEVVTAVVATTGGAALPDDGGPLVPTLHIPGFTHPVEEHYLEDVLTMTGHVIEEGSRYAKKAHQPERGGGASGLGFSEMVAQRSGIGVGRGGGKGKDKGFARAELRRRRSGRSTPPTTRARTRSTCGARSR